MPIKSTGRVMCFVVTVSTLWSCGLGACQEQTAKVKIGYLPMVSSLAHFVARDKGFYEEEHLDVEANPIKTSNLMAQDLVGGHIDVAIELSLIPLLKQLEASKGAAKVFSVSRITSENGFDGVVVKSSSVITNLAMLSGKKVGVFPGTTAKKTFERVFRARYPDLSLPTFLDMDPSVHIQALERGDLDALHSYEPTLTLGIVKQGFKRIHTSIYADQYSPNPIGVAAVNARWLEQNTKTARALFAALDRAVVFMQRNPSEARSILSRATKLDESVAAVMNVMPMSESGKIDGENLRGYLLTLREMGEIQIVPDIADLCTK
jgi:ABC-type nitrate/sulfonate/bicarbonate transport system substrate-binding protein